MKCDLFEKQAVVILSDRTAFRASEGSKATNLQG